VIIFPLARAAIRTILQSMTKSIVNFINGKSGGNGQPSFVQDLATHLQAVGDSAALAFLSQVNQAVIGAGLKNPYFGSAIAMAVKANYLRQTSLEGFFKANMCTLSKYSPNVNRFLAGDWSQGGAGAWLALTTQDNNNPYAVYLAAQNQVNSNVSQAQTNRKQDLASSNGFLSWCPGDSVSSNSEAGQNAICQSCLDACDAKFANDSAGAATCSEGCAPKCGGGTSSSVGVSPQAQCTNADGTPAKAVTPGSIIHDYAQKGVVNSGFDQLISANDIDSSLNAIMGAFITNVFSGTGIFGVSANSSGSGRALYNQLNNYSASSENLTTTVAATAEDKLAQLGIYTSAWNTINESAITASTSVKTLIQFCTEQRDTASTTLANLTKNRGPRVGLHATDTSNEQDDLIDVITSSTQQIDAANIAFAKIILPVLMQAQEASTTASTTRALAARFSSETSEGVSTTTNTTMSADTKTFISAPPSLSDIQFAQKETEVSGKATADPARTLNVSGGSLVDKMNLISKNADAIKANSCTIPPDPSASTDSGSSGSD
jgi:hypothetical protein